MAMIEVKISGLVQDKFNNNLWVILLEDEANKRILPIWIGTFEANSIAMELSSQVTPRPMTHDLIKNIIGSLDAEIDWVAVNDIRDNTYYAIIMLRHNGREIAVDARPSDSIAIALRCKVPILVSEQVIEKKAAIDISLPKDEEGDEWIDKMVDEIQAPPFTPSKEENNEPDS